MPGAAFNLSLPNATFYGCGGSPRYWAGTDDYVVQPYEGWPGGQYASASAGDAPGGAQTAPGNGHHAAAGQSGIPGVNGAPGAGLHLIATGFAQGAGLSGTSGTSGTIGN